MQKLYVARIFFTKAALGLFFALGLLSGACKGDDSADEQALGALLVAALNTCTVGGVNFSAGSGVTCSGGTATGTGTLTALTTANDDHSLQVTFTLASGGTLDVLAGANLNANGGAIARGFGVQFTNSGATAVGPTDSSGSQAAMAAAADTSVVRCVDIHQDESPPHIVGKSAACPTGTESASSQSIDDESRSGSAGTNRGWGLILSSATVTGLVQNGSRKFTE